MGARGRGGGGQGPSGVSAGGESGSGAQLPEPSDFLNGSHFPTAFPSVTTLPPCPLSTNLALGPALWGSRQQAPPPGEARPAPPPPGSRPAGRKARAQHPGGRGADDPEGPAKMSSPDCSTRVRPEQAGDPGGGPAGDFLPPSGRLAHHPPGVLFPRVTQSGPAALQGRKGSRQALPSALGPGSARRAGGLCSAEGGAGDVRDHRRGAERSPNHAAIRWGGSFQVRNVPTTHTFFTRFS